TMEQTKNHDGTHSKILTYIKNTFASLASLATFALKNPRVEQSERLPFLNKRTHFQNQKITASDFII
ncbi:MAG: hypothetical protein ACYSUG_02345, partial [Planctomycetota bacterium]